MQASMNGITCHLVLLIHGWEIMQNLLVPVAMLSEEAQEANNKNIKSYRLNFARKTSM